MKNKFLLVLLLVSGVILGGFIYSLISSPDIKIEQRAYVHGQTHLIERTVNLIELKINLPDIKFKADTIDTTKCYAESNFKIDKDSVAISGRVTYDEPFFSFENIKIKYPEITKTLLRIDTLKITQTLTTPFYSDNWFWGFLGAISLLIASLL